MTILPPLVEKLWFREAATFVVADTGACLNLRVAPDAEAEVIRCLPDGASLVLLEPARASDKPEWLCPMMDWCYLVS